jgi:hypothetical protein
MPEKERDDLPESDGRSRDENTGWQRPDEESLTPFDTDVEEEEPFDSIADSPVGYVLEDTEVEEGETLPLEGEDTDDFITIGTNPDAVMDQIDDYTKDQDVLQDFSERQNFTNDSDSLYGQLRQHHSKKPQLSGGDLDAAWQDSDVSGEESVGGSTPTPDQDRVDELGSAVGITYDDDEPLATADKLGERDRNRWELDPASAAYRAEQIDDDDLEDDDLDDGGMNAEDDDLDLDLLDEDDEDDDFLDDDLLEDEILDNAADDD